MTSSGAFTHWRSALRSRVQEVCLPRNNNLNASARTPIPAITQTSTATCRTNGIGSWTRLKTKRVIAPPTEHQRRRKIARGQISFTCSSGTAFQRDRRRMFTPFGCAWQHRAPGVEIRVNKVDQGGNVIARMRMMSLSDSTICLNRVVNVPQDDAEGATAQQQAEQEESDQYLDRPCLHSCPSTGHDPMIEIVQEPNDSLYLNIRP